MKFYIWSIDRQKYWKEKALGYSEYKQEAGLFDLEAAVDHCYEPTETIHFRPRHVLIPVKEGV